jgi:hypothetical protein
VAFRKKIYGTISALQADLDLWIAEYNERRPHQGRWCFGKTPIQTFLDTIPLAKEKIMGPLDDGHQTHRLIQPTPSVRSNRSYYRSSAHRLRN